MNAVIAAVSYPLYIEFVMAALAFRWRWVRPVVWLGCLYAIYRVYFDSAIRDTLAIAMAASALTLSLHRPPCVANRPRRIIHRPGVPGSPGLASTQ